VSLLDLSQHLNQTFVTYPHPNLLAIKKGGMSYQKGLKSAIFSNSSHKKVLPIVKDAMTQIWIHAAQMVSSCSIPAVKGPAAGTP
jgi:hypothetical protein